MTHRYIRAIKGIKHHQWARSHRKGRRKKGNLWEYNWDGEFLKERIRDI
ncbi:hypothetical protein LCGC14_1739870 [marine sediment metagenome]|uniref:Uncharacterized protein n=1 Tax=marine sediment metagenome TaxID=412755 RepID=A0A0F9H6Z6_9ZZZZ